MGDIVDGVGDFVNGVGDFGNGMFNPRAVEQEDVLGEHDDDDVGIVVLFRESDGQSTTRRKILRKG